MKTITIAIFTIILNACGASKSSDLTTNAMNKLITENDLNGKFNVTLIESVNNLPENITLEFNSTNMKISGYAGCNGYTGDYSLDGNAIKIKNIIATERFCEGKAGEIENKLMKLLSETNKFSLEYNILVLSNGTKKLVSATNNINSKMTQEDIKIEYRTHARGSFTKIILDNKTISIQESYDGKPNVTTFKDEDWNKMQKLVSEMNLKTITTLEAPSKAHQYDGAAMANFTITKDGETFEAPVFDAGNPNKELHPLVNLVLNIAKASKEKN